MSDFINSELGHCDVVNVDKNPMSKNKCDLSCLENKKWKVSSISRGKELILIFDDGIETKKLKIGFARVGCIECVPISSIDKADFDKRAMLRLYTSDKVLYLADFTRYAIWRWSDWDPTRSPDLYFEHNQWRSYLHSKKNTVWFDQAVFHVMSDQRYFNGIGNFSRTEILSRTRFSPFTHLSEILEVDILRNDFFSTCKDVIGDIYNKGGLQHIYWKNPFNISTTDMNNWIRCYNKLEKGKPSAVFLITDRDGRKFWFDRKWTSEYVKYANTINNVVDVLDTRLLKKIYRTQK